MIARTGSHEFSWSWGEEARDGPVCKGPTLISRDASIDLETWHHLGLFQYPESQGISMVSRDIVITTLLSSLEERPDHHYSKGSEHNARYHTRKTTTFLCWVIAISAPNLHFHLPGVEDRWKRLKA
jgi:hypothetical protein